MLPKQSYAKRLVHPNDEIAAYILGFLSADGHIRLSNIKGGVQGTISISLQAWDIEIIELIRTYLAPTTRICKYTINGKDYVRFRHGNRPVITEILKTFRKTMLHIPTDLNRHFIRGLFDGDGNIAKHTISHKMYNIKISFSDKDKLIIDEVATILDNHNIKTTIYKDNHCLALHAISKDSVIKWLHFMYDNCNVSLTRKHNQAKELFSIVENREEYIMSNTGHRKCSKCNETKLLCMFMKDSRTPSGYMRICKACYKMRRNKPLTIAIS